MTPHRHELARAGAACVGETHLERAPQRSLGRGHRGRTVLRDGLGEFLHPFTQAVRRIDDLADHAELVGPAR
jgi:hypothetical protein